MSAPLLRFDDEYSGNVVRVDLDTLLRSRLLVQANSGGGKSRAIRSMLEQTNGQVQHLILDPEGEFSTLREKFAYVLAGKEGDVPAHPKVARALCRKLLEIGASAVIDLYDLSLQERREFVKLFLLELMALPKSLWKPLLVVIDEAHFFAPQNDEAQSRDAVIALCTQGRKRGFCAVLATQRISKLHKDAAAELGNKLIGRTGLDVDMKRAGDELGMDKDGRMSLRTLEPGHFYAFGPAIGAGVQLVVTSDVITTHPDSNTIGMIVPPPTASVQAMIAKIGDLPKLAAEQEEHVAKLERTVKELQAQVRARVQPATPAVDIEAVVAERVAPAIRRITETVERETAAQRALLVEEIDRVASGVERIQSMLAKPYALSVSVQDAEPSSYDTSPAAYAQRVLRDIEPHATPKRRELSPAVVTSGVSRPQQRMLDALADFEAVGLDAPNYSHVAIWSSQSPKSSGFEKNLSTLSASGYVTRGAGRTLSLTDAGRAIAKTVTEPRSLDELHEAWIAYVSGPQQRMIRALLAVRSHEMHFDSLAAKSEQSPTSSGFGKNLSTLSALGIVERKPGRVIALGRLMFPEGLP